MARVKEECVRHYEDNQGLCHACGKPMNIDGWYAWAGYTDEVSEQWDAMIAKWDAEHSTR